MKVLVIGGTSFIGRYQVAELLKAGHEVTILHRKPNHDLGRRVANLVADRNDPASLRATLSGYRFNAVFDNAYDWERGTTAAHIEATVQILGNRLTRYIFMSSVGAYGDGLNHYEGDPLAPDYHSDAYGRNKAMAERLLFRLHQRTGFPVVTFRPPFVYGPGNPFYREAFFWDRLRAGRPVIIPGDGHRLMQFVYVRDLVEATLRALDHPGAVGEAFNIGNPRPVSQSELVALLAQVAGVEPTLVRVARDVIQQAGGNPMGEPAYFGVYYDLPAITENVTKVTRVLKVRPTPFEQGLKETYRAWLRTRGTQAPDFTFEDRLLQAVRSASQQR